MRILSSMPRDVSLWLKCRRPASGLCLCGTAHHCGAATSAPERRGGRGDPPQHLLPRRSRVRCMRVQRRMERVLRRGNMAVRQQLRDERLISTKVSVRRSLSRNCRGAWYMSSRAMHEHVRFWLILSRLYDRMHTCSVHTYG